VFKKWEAIRRRWGKTRTTLLEIKKRWFGWRGFKGFIIVITSLKQGGHGQQALVLAVVFMEQP